ncbi:hypothetical protein MMON_33280 [Mycolicibacterium monacense]|uniref:Uncharacterized protein n=1 Tax=Mycolicibacterium monacense TaxID=85693 RepID=A0AAD1IYJ6_MYCMB|nr:hypothetical protein MMON_33280 [Mycolicibacterium monacense]
MPTSATTVMVTSQAFAERLVAAASAAVFAAGCVSRKGRAPSGSQAVKTERDRP